MTAVRQRPEQAARERRVSTQDGCLTFEFQRITVGVLVARIHTTQTQQVEHAVVIGDRQLFAQYLALDELRFQYIPFYLELQRIFDELLAIAP